MILIIYQEVQILMQLLKIYTKIRNINSLVMQIKLVL
jgi:hypothetical protein